MTFLTVKLDKTAIGLSALCIVHCLLLPVSLTILPSIAILSTLSDEVFHVLLIALVLPTSMVALLLGCKRHKSSAIFALGIGGLMTLGFTAVFGHDVLGEQMEKVATVIGALMVAGAHIQNFRLCRQTDCES